MVPCDVSELPRLLSDLVPAAGIIKQHADDFVVEEVPLYPFDGRGTHTCMLIEKVGLSTVQAAANVAQALNVRRRDIGYAGLKDARAVTRQWFSVEHVDPARVVALDVPRVRVLQVTRHGNKLRLGHLRGNRFVIRVRHVDAARFDELEAGLRRLCRLGVPNYFGRQRFGGRGDTWALGRALLRDDVDEAIEVLLGRPGEADRGSIRRARELFDEGRFAEAARHWPGLFIHERRALRTLERTGGNRRRAVHSIDAFARRFYVSAYQSHLFNAIVARRLVWGAAGGGAARDGSTGPGGLGTLMRGDLAYVHAADRVFLVDDPDAEQPRADALQISPTGPLFGYRMSKPQGLPGEWEAELLAGEGLSESAFRSGRLRTKGVRRALRVPVEDARMELGADRRGPYVELRFGLPRGAYATALLRELFREPTGAGDEESQASRSADG